MQETWHCPICGDKMRGIVRSKEQIEFLGDNRPNVTYSERSCSGINHSLLMCVNNKSKQVDLLKVSLVPDYSRFIFIDFYNQKSRIVCMKNNKKTHFVDLPKMIEPDFPNLQNLKERVSMLITFI